MAAAGYPGAYPKDMEISGLEKINDNQMVFQAGTSRRDGRVVSSGGRVLNVVGHGSTLQEAIYETYAAVSGIRFDDAFFRRDIGRKGLPDE
jgi:phosphoribosylamine--glycine ligase